VRGREDAHINRNLPIRTDAADRLSLEHAQELWLEIDRDFADLVEKNRPAVCFLERADALRMRSGERAFLVSEELTLEECWGIAVQSTTTKGPGARRLAPWSASAAPSLPVPVSPWISTVTSLGAHRSSSAKRRRITSERPTTPRSSSPLRWAAPSRRARESAR